GGAVQLADRGGVDRERDEKAGPQPLVEDVVHVEVVGTEDGERNVVLLALDEPCNVTEMHAGDGDDTAGEIHAAAEEEVVCRFRQREPECRKRNPSVPRPD